MVQVTEAIFTRGVLQPTGPLVLEEQQRVRVTIESVEPEPAQNREIALRELRTRLLNSGLRYGGRLPRRDELYDRF